MLGSQFAGKRLLEYKGILKKLKALGFTRVFSSNLADSLGISASLVRKDFSTLSTSGNKRGGYKIDELLGEINRLLHKDVVTEAVLVGVGKLGAALLGYRGFEEEKIEFIAAFDDDPAKIREERRVPIYPIDKLPAFIVGKNIRIGVLAVPEEAAQRVADIMVLAGVKGFLNFAPGRLVLPPDCHENHIDLAMELERLVFQVGNGDKEVKSG
jgi:redox-sensing transcriptional repressor